MGEGGRGGSERVVRGEGGVETWGEEGGRRVGRRESVKRGRIVVGWGRGERNREERVVLVGG
mgnify:FL=1